ncbi:MAG: hypothetical protein AVDCRST_MAG03-2974, partial [uncultured Rubrobacteraceae bacterium]
DPGRDLRPRRHAGRDGGAKGALLRPRRQGTPPGCARSGRRRRLQGPGRPPAPGGRDGARRTLRARRCGPQEDGGVRGGDAVAGLRAGQVARLRAPAGRPRPYREPPLSAQRGAAARGQTPGLPDGPRHYVPSRAGAARARHPRARGRVRRGGDPRRRRARQAGPGDRPARRARARGGTGGVPDPRGLPSRRGRGSRGRHGGHRRHHGPHPPEVPGHEPPEPLPGRVRPAGPAGRGAARDLGLRQSAREKVPRHESGV